MSPAALMQTETHEARGEARCALLGVLTCDRHLVRQHPGLGVGMVPTAAPPFMTRHTGGSRPQWGKSF